VFLDMKWKRRAGQINREVVHKHGDGEILSVYSVPACVFCGSPLLFSKGVLTACVFSA
jgi:hypothetical protein